METNTRPHCDADILAKMLVSAILQGTDAVKNEGHKIAPCPALIWEDSYHLDNESLAPIEN